MKTNMVKINIYTKFKLLFNIKTIFMKKSILSVVAGVLFMGSIFSNLSHSEAKADGKCFTQGHLEWVNIMGQNPIQVVICDGSGTEVCRIDCPPPQ